jgi:hypothetical protein
MFSYTLTPNTMNLVIGNKIHTVDKSHINYVAIRDAVREYSTTEYNHHRTPLVARIKEMLDIKKFIAKFTEGAIQVGEDQVLFHGKPVHGVIADRLIALVSEGFSPAPLARFLMKLQANPSTSARDELYLWLETSKLPICDDGDFLAYKAVRADYLSHHDGKTDNRIGSLLQMKREDVDPDRDNTCSRGYHFCSLDYLSMYTGSRIMICKVDPSDVVTIPSDYSNQKGRAWRYVIVDEVANASAASTYLQGVSIARADVGDVGPGGELEVVTKYQMTDNDRLFVQNALPIGSDRTRLRLEAIRDVLAGDTDWVFSIFTRMESPQGADFWFHESQNKSGVSPTARAILEAYVAYYEELKSIPPVRIDDVEDVTWTEVTSDYLPGGALEYSATTPQPDGKYEIVLSNGKRTITLGDLKAMLNEHGERGTSRMTGIPRTTLQGWRKKFNV